MAPVGRSVGASSSLTTNLNGPVPDPADSFDSGPEWPDTLEFLSVFARSFQKRFYFALFAVGYDTGGKGSRADFRVRLPYHKLGPQLLVNRDVVKSA